MILLDKNRLHRILKRMAYQAVEISGGQNIDLIGLNQRGYAVSTIITNHITENFATQVHHNQLNVDSPEKPVQVDKKNCVLIIADDVIYSGKTMFKALNSITELYNYKDVYVAAVIDRGHRRLPVEAEIVGVIVPTKANELVDFRLSGDTPSEVRLIKK